MSGEPERWTAWLIDRKGDGYPEWLSRVYPIDWTTDALEAKLLGVER